MMGWPWRALTLRVRVFTAHSGPFRRRMLTSEGLCRYLSALVLYHQTTSITAPIVANHELDKTAVSEEGISNKVCQSILTEQGSKRCWNARANLWAFGHSVRRQAGRAGTLHGVAEKRLTMGCNDFDMCGDTDFLFDGG